MTAIPRQQPGQKKLGLVIDLDTCVGCHACAVNCKEWNASGHSAPLTDYRDKPSGVWFNRVHTFEAGEGASSRTVHFPRSCLHCEEPACVTVCPTGASYKRTEDGIVLVNADTCIGCKLCSWACPYGAREFDEDFLQQIPRVRLVAGEVQEKGIEWLAVFVVEPGEFRFAPHGCPNDAPGGGICLAIKSTGRTVFRRWLETAAGNAPESDLPSLVRRAVDERRGAANASFPPTAARPHEPIGA